MNRLRDNFSNLNLIFKRESDRFVATLDNGQKLTLTKIIVKTETKLEMLSTDLKKYNEYLNEFYYEMDDFDISILSDKESLIRKITSQLRMVVTNEDNKFIFNVDTNRIDNNVVYILNLEVIISKHILTKKKLICVNELVIEL